MSAIILEFPRSVMDAASNLIEAADRFEQARQRIDREADDMRARMARNQQAYWARREAEAGNDTGPDAA